MSRPFHLKFKRNELRLKKETRLKNLNEPSKHLKNDSLRKNIPHAESPSFVVDWEMPHLCWNTED